MLSSHSTPYHVAFGSFVDVATGPTYLIVPRKSLSSRILVPTKDCGGPFVASRRAAIYLSFFSAGPAFLNSCSTVVERSAALAQARLSYDAQEAL